MTAAEITMNHPSRIASILAAALFAACPLYAATTTPAPMKTTGSKPMPTEKADARFSAADANADGKLSATELATMNPKFDAERFAKLDTNADGGVSRDELRQAHAARVGRAVDGKSPKAGQGKAGGGLRDRFAAMDSNGDGGLTREEIGDKAPRLIERFSALDVDGDGRITGAEMQAARAAKNSAKTPAKP